MIKSLLAYSVIVLSLLSCGTRSLNGDIFDEEQWNDLDVYDIGLSDISSDSWSSDIHIEVILEDNEYDLQEEWHGVGSLCDSAEDCYLIENEPVCLIDDFGHINGYCSTRCVTDADCSLGSTCLDYLSEKYCHLDCKNDDDCVRHDYYCISTGHCLSLLEI